MPASFTLANLFDPRGRCNRKGLLVMAIALLIVQAAIGLALWTRAVPPDAVLLAPVKAAVFWIATVAVLKRLHDIRTSGWAFVGAVIGWFVWTVMVALICFTAFGIAAAEIGTSAFFIYLGLVSAPMLAATLWLHFAPGDTGPNRFGPVPDATGFSMPAAREPPAAADLSAA